MDQEPGAAPTVPAVAPAEKGFDIDNPYQEGPHLTRKAMEAILARGGSILHKGAVITEPAALPAAAELAKGHAVATAHTLADLRAQVRTLDAQIASLTEGAALGAGGFTSASPGKMPPLGTDAQAVPPDPTFGGVTLPPEQGSPAAGAKK